MSHPLFVLPPNASGWAVAAPVETKNTPASSFYPLASGAVSPAPTYEQATNPLMLQDQSAIAVLRPDQQAAINALHRQTQQAMYQQQLQQQLSYPHQQHTTHHQPHAAQSQLPLQGFATTSYNVVNAPEAAAPNAYSALTSSMGLGMSATPVSGGSHCDDGLYSLDAVLSTYSKSVICDLGSTAPCPPSLTERGLKPATWARIAHRCKEMKSKSDTNKIILHVLGGIFIGIIFNVMVAKHWVGNKPLRRQLAGFLEKENAQLAQTGVGVRFVWQDGALRAFYK